MKISAWDDIVHIDMCASVMLGLQCDILEIEKVSQGKHSK